MWVVEVEVEVVVLVVVVVDQYVFIFHHTLNIKVFLYPSRNYKCLQHTVCRSDFN